MYFYKIAFIFIILSLSLQADVRYQRGWNLLGGELSLADGGNEEIWVFKDSQWILRPKRIEKHQGFWFNAPTSGTLKTYNHIFDQNMPALYSLHSIIIQYTGINKQVEYARNELIDSYMNIKSDMSFEEFVTISVKDSNPISQVFKGKFMPLSGNTKEIVEYDNASKTYFVSSIILDNNILVLIRKELSDKYGVVNKKYTYTRE